MASWRRRLSPYHCGVCNFVNVARAILSDGSPLQGVPSSIMSCINSDVTVLLCPRNQYSNKVSRHCVIMRRRPLASVYPS